MHCPLRAFYELPLCFTLQERKKVNGNKLDLVGCHGRGKKRLSNTNYKLSIERLRGIPQVLLLLKIPLLCSLDL